MASLLHRACLPKEQPTKTNKPKNPTNHSALGMAPLPHFSCLIPTSIKFFLKKKKVASAARNIKGLNTVESQVPSDQKECPSMPWWHTQRPFKYSFERAAFPHLLVSVSWELGRKLKKITSELKQLQRNPSRKKKYMPEHLSTKTPPPRERKGCLLWWGEWACEYLCAQLQEYFTITRCRKQEWSTLCKNTSGNERYAPLKDMHSALRIKLFLHLHSYSIFIKRYPADSSYSSSAAMPLWHDRLEISSKASLVLPSQYWIYQMQIRCKQPGLLEHHSNNSSILECTHLLEYH